MIGRLGARGSRAALLSLWLALAVLLGQSWAGMAVAKAPLVPVASAIEFQQALVSQARPAVPALRDSASHLVQAVLGQHKGWDAPERADPPLGTAAPRVRHLVLFARPDTVPAGLPAAARRALPVTDGRARAPPFA